MLGISLYCVELRSMVLYLIVLFGITWYCISFDCISCSFIVLYGMAWHGIVLYLNLLYSIACYFMVSYGIALYCIVLDFIARYWIPFHYIVWYCMSLYCIWFHCIQKQKPNIGERVTWSRRYHSSEESLSVVENEYFLFRLKWCHSGQQKCLHSLPALPNWLL